MEGDLIDCIYGYGCWQRPKKPVHHHHHHLMPWFEKIATICGLSNFVCTFYKVFLPWGITTLYSDDSA
jgi:hypothetical protein